MIEEEETAGTLVWPKEDLGEPLWQQLERIALRRVTKAVPCMQLRAAQLVFSP